MTSLRLGTGPLDFLNSRGLVRPAIEKFAGAWLACFVVMAHGDFANALSLNHARLAFNLWDCWSAGCCRSSRANGPHYKLDVATDDD